MLTITNEGRKALRKTIGRFTAEVAIQAAFMSGWSSPKRAAVLLTIEGEPFIVESTTTSDMTESGIPVVSPGEVIYYKWEPSSMKWVKS